MAGLTLEQCDAQLAVWLEASTKIAGKQSYSIDGRTLTYADASEVNENIKYWDKMCRKLSRNKGNIQARSLRARD